MVVTAMVLTVSIVFFFKQKTAYEMRISDWSSDVCSSDLVALDLGFFQLRWYSLAYLAGILVGWWYLLKLMDRPGAPMARRHADDMVFYATLGILLGGRLGYVLWIGRASCRKECVSTCRSRWSPYH